MKYNPDFQELEIILKILFEYHPSTGVECACNAAKIENVNSGDWLLISLKIINDNDKQKLLKQNNAVNKPV